MKRTILINIARACLLGLLIFAANRAGAAADLSNSLALSYNDGAGHIMPYRLFLPDGYNQPGAEFPLVLFLHGAGESGTNNTLQVSVHIDGLINATRSGPYASFLLAPQLPASAGWGSQNPSDLSMEILDSVLANYSVDTDRLYITGLSMGGFGSFNYISEFPQKFAAAVPMSGGGDSSAANAQRIKDVPTWMFHGNSDGTVSVQNSINMYNALTAAGGTPQLTILPNQGHVIWGPIYSDDVINKYGLYPWLFAQAVPEPSSFILAGIAGAALFVVGKRRRPKAER